MVSSPDPIGNAWVMHGFAHLPGGEVEKLVEAKRREFFGWGESCQSIDIQFVPPFAPPEKCFAKARIFRPPLRGDGISRARPRCVHDPIGNVNHRSRVPELTVG